MAALTSPISDCTDTRRGSRSCLVWTLTSMALCRTSSVSSYILGQAEHAGITFGIIGKSRIPA
jgi:hypothetical protein